MKVLWLTNIPAPYKVDLFNELGKKVDLTVLFERSGAANRNDKWNGASFDNFTAVFLKGIKIGEENSFCPSVKRYLKKYYDKIVIGGYGTFTAMYAIRRLKKTGIRYYLSIDGGVIREESARKYKLKRSLVSGAYAYLCPSKSSEDYLAHYGAERNRIFRYPFTSVKQADIQKASAERKEYIKKRLFVNEKKVVVSIGQFIPRKGFDLLTKAAASLPQDYGVYIIGGKATEEYVALRKQLKLANVHFVPFLDKKHTAEYYDAADIFVLPTREDIWGLVVNEAMAHGLGVITTDNCVAGLELVNNGENGFIIPVNDSEAIVKAVKDAEEKGFSSLGEGSLSVIKQSTVEKEAAIIAEILEK